MSAAFLSVAELAAELKIKPSVLYGMRYRGDSPPAVKFGRELRFPRAEFERWLAERATTGTRGRKAAS